ncbi:F-box protein SKIP23-like protein [Cinnamomum micranthum f. kanehirae]|uniref:F-box protein SKIP23-like protein n=1 Tax=Cinnamomum micranthum f. kanehirae TaxID=337451 RepID=A0A3S3QGL6_9MAGN|nr:F-box protein SKIP23-like protein [Cinnamomum micranthum f. kanehirae]
MNKWSEGLPQDVFDRILNLCSFLDSIRVGFVCKSWHRISNLNMIRRPQLPWLMMPSNPNCKSEEEGEGEEEEEGLCVFSLSNNTFYYDIKIPHIRGKSCYGSFSNSGGWLMSIDRNLEVQLFHPWRRIYLNLPRFSISNVFDISPDFDSELSKPTIIKAAMSDDATVVAVISSSRNFAFCRTGEDMIWTLIDVSHQVYRDIIYYKGQFYSVRWDGAIAVLNINTTNPYVETLTGGVNFISRKPTPLQSEMRTIIHHRTYLVPDLESESLFIVRRLAQVDFDGGATYIYTTYDFQVHELELQGGEGRKSVEVESLGDRVMFLGLNSSMLVMASQFSVEVTWKSGKLKGRCWASSCFCEIHRRIYVNFNRRVHLSV